MSGPIFASAVLAVDLLAALAPAWCDEMLPLIAAGTARIAVVADGLLRPGTGPALDGQGRLSGTADVLAADDHCTHYLVVTDSQLALVEADPPGPERPPAERGVVIERSHGFVPEAFVARFSSTPARTQSIDATDARAAVLRATPILARTKSAAARRSSR